MPARPGATSRLVEHELRIAAPPEIVFAYFTDPARMVEWFGMQATLDPRPGGACRIQTATGAVMVGSYVEVEPPRRVVFTWGFEPALFATPAESTTVEVTLTPDGDGTVLHLAHGGIAADAEAFHRAGWAHYLARLADAARGAPPPEDSWTDTRTVLRALDL
jgi:uncharacterized protein YndB with AHSA1/START domain